MPPQIYLGHRPDSPLQRRQLRAFALELCQRLRHADGPCVAILQAIASDGQTVLLLRPRSVIIGLLKAVDAHAPLDVRHDHPWLLEARQARTACVGNLSPWPLGTPVAAVVVVPALPAGSQIALDVEDHRQRVKVLAIDELAPLASMLQADAQLDAATMQQIAAQLGAQHWHDGERFLFEIGLAPYTLRIVGRDAAPLPLLEGATVIGRREQPLQREYRLTISGDDTISADHALLVCDGERVLVRDTSTNGTLVRTPDGAEHLLQRGECRIATGTVLHMGQTELRLEH